jgi:predicted dehydrogenase
MTTINSSFRGTESAVINTALCAFGMSGLVFHAAFIHANPGFNLYGVWERSQKTAAEIYPRIRSFDDLESMLADDAIDLVIINTPNYTHFEFAKKALLAGKHVLVEKSFTVTVSEAEELILLANEKNKELAVFQNRRYDSDFKTVKKIVDDGILGKITKAEFHFHRYKPELSPKKHKESGMPGSGLLHDLGPHIIDQALYLFGIPVSVFGILKITRTGSLVNDDIEITLNYPDRTVYLKAGLLVKEFSPAYFLLGTNGTFTKERADVQEDILKLGQKPGTKNWGTEPETASGMLKLNKNGKTKQMPVKSLQGNYMEFYDGLYDSIISGKPLPVSAQEGLNVMRLIEAVQESDRVKKVILF